MKRFNLHILLLIILMVTALVYARALQNGILAWDDQQHITNNSDIKSLSLQNVKEIFTSYYVSMYHPLVTLSFAVEYHFFGVNPVPYHAINVFFHLMNVALVFAFVFVLSQRRATAIVAACLFAIHPMHVESVAWITERKDVVYAFFYLCALIFYLRFIQQETMKNYGMVLFFVILSLLSKTAAITFPIVLFIIDLYKQRNVTVRTLLEKSPFIVLSLVFGVIALYSQGAGPQYYVKGSFNFIDRIFLASYSLCYYLIHLFVPVNLSALHLVPIKANGFLPVEYYLALLPVVILAYTATRKGIFQREYVFGLLFFVAGVSLNLHAIPVGIAIVSERYTYLAYIGIYYILGQLYCFSLDRYPELLVPWKKGILICAACIALFFGYLTYQRIGVWKNTVTLFQDATKKSGNTIETNFNQTLTYLFEADELNRSGQSTDAIECYNKAIALSPRMAELYLNRGVVNVKLHHYAEAMNDYEKALELNPSLAAAYTNRAYLYVLLNRQEDACADLWKAYRLGMHDAFDVVHANCF